MTQRLLAVVAIVTATLASAQVYPGATPISLLVPFSAGGPTDRVAHDLADAMRKTLVPIL